MSCSSYCGIHPPPSSRDHVPIDLIHGITACHVLTLYISTS
ncbi:hypothetical protein LINPERHAP1_LOCUS7464 [Linum perenne]